MRINTLEIGAGTNPDKTYLLHNDTRALPGIEVIGPCQDLKFPNGSISLIFMNQVFEHIPYADQHDLLKKMKKWLCSGGGLIISTPDLDYINALEDKEWQKKLLEGGRTDEYDHHVGLVNKKELRRLLESNGFTIVNMATIDGSIRCSVVHGSVWY